ncbi:uracil-DNA glycosylase [Ellagibacter isourolithinifaciens]|uniref:uracil-DNA glycosylase n=1 Tax=Ellagibacter isourolithinifaciens TaxID=2137581 RepID=UPI003A907C05
MEETVEKQESIDAWFALVPEQAKATARRLLLEVDNLRREEIIYPPQGDILNVLAYVAPEDVRAVILGQDPYHGPGQAMGLSFSVPKGEKLPPSLRNIYKEMASDLGCSIPVSGDLSAWAQQGVLLLNTTLTVREHEANSHSKLGWQVVTTAIVEACMRLPQPVVFLAWGRPAIKVIESAKSRAAKDAFEGGACAGAADSGADDHASSGTAPAVADSSGSLAGGALSRKFILKSTHPSPLSASRAAGDLPAFLGSRPFSRANDLLKECGVEPIDWSLAG